MPIIKLHRGSTNTMSNTNKKNIVLESGELFIEIPDNEVTEDNQYKFKVGDGSTTYENLPYAIDPTNISNNNSSNENSNESIEDYIEKNNIILSGSTTTVTFIDDSIKSNSNVELLCNIENIYYSSISISNGTCTIVFPKQSTNIVVSFRLYVDTPYYKSIQLPNNIVGTATVDKVKSGKTFSSANGIGLIGTATLSPYYRNMGDTVYCNLTGIVNNGYNSPSATNYNFDIVYTGPVTYGDPTSGYKMCLLGNSNVYSGGAYWTRACNFRWTATFAAGQVSDNEVTIENVKISTLEEIQLYCNNREYKSDRFTYNGRFWTSTENTNATNYAYAITSSGECIGELKENGIYISVVPYITINL